MSTGRLRLLSVDDSDDEVALLHRELRRAGLDFEARRVWTPDALRAALAEPWDVVLSDWSMPGFDGLAAYRVMRELGLDLPFIIVSGTIGDEIAITALKAGVHDFVSKDKLARLVPAITRELREAEGRRRQRDADAEIVRQRELVARSEASYRAMFERSPLPMWTFDPESRRFVAVNDAALRYYGYSRDEFLARRLEDLWPDADASAGLEAASFARTRVWKHRKKDGTSVAVELGASELLAEERRLRLVVVHDVTERERPSRRPLGLWIALVLLLAITVLMATSTQRLVATIDRIEHTHRVIEDLATIDADLGGLTAMARGYALTGNADELRGADVLEREVAAALASVRGEVAIDLNPDLDTQGQQLDELERIAARLAVAREATSVPDATRAAAELRTLTGAMTGVERTLLADERADTSRQVLYERIAEVAGTALGLAMMLGAFAGLARETRRRRAAEEASRRDEESLATTLQSIGDGVVAHDARGLVVRMNRVAEQLTGWTTAAAAGRPFADVCRIRDADAREPTLVARDGTEIAVTTSTAPIRDASGAESGAVVVFRDASAERAWERQLAAANAVLDSVNADLERRVVERTAALHRSEEQLRQAQKLEAIGRLAGGIAHDFNNLLSVIISYSEMLVSDLEPGVLPDESVADIREIHKAGMRAADLTRQLLAFSRQQVLVPRVVDLNEVITGVDKMLRRLIGADIELRTLPRAGGVRAKVDPGQIEQVIMNLVVNARDAMPRGGTLTIETARVELDDAYATQHAGVTPGPYAMLAVTDSGAGMTREVQARVFEPFFTTKDTGKGTGLGLATVHGIVRQSGGSVWLYSEPGLGTTFKIYLPETREGVEAAARPSARADARGSGTVLLVEDEPAVRALARGILARAGYEVLEAGDGVDALAASARFTGAIQLVVTDVVMPRMSGRELVERLVAARPEIKVLYMSGYTDDTIVHHGVLERDAAFVQKPLTPEALTAKVRDVLAART